MYIFEYGINLVYCMYIQYCLALMQKCIMICVNKYKVLTNRRVASASEFSFCF